MLHMLNKLTWKSTILTALQIYGLKYWIVLKVAQITRSKNEFGLKTALRLKKLQVVLAFFFLLFVILVV